MDVTKIPFAKHIGIEYKDEGTLKLEPTSIVQNHIQSIHASAQFALAETQSGLYLQKVFPEYLGKVIGILRGSTVKYKNPAKTNIYAVANIDTEVRQTFLKHIEQKNRASIIINVQLKDNQNTLIMEGKFNWFIQKI